RARSRKSQCQKKSPAFVRAGAKGTQCAPAEAGVSDAMPLGTRSHWRKESPAIASGAGHLNGDKLAEASCALTLPRSVAAVTAATKRTASDLERSSSYKSEEQA